MKKSKNIRKDFKNPFKLSMFFLKNMPMGFLNGLKIVEIDDNHASVSVPYNFLTKNPFKSMYFAVQSMAAELSSGVIAIEAVTNATVPVSMLVLKMEAEFIKKARSKIIFTCNDARAIVNTIQNSIETNEGKEIKITSIGKDIEGDIVSKFYFTWTFKPKKI
ncbi:MAG: DUF4442 domain-containing protein [Bacteroidota bacterium]|nr:DUF4442 domain-containing protein [Bacteroidota bacterium]